MTDDYQGLAMANATHRRLIALSIAASVATIGLKTAAWLLTGSVSLFSDAAESLVNLTASLLALGALIYSARPADAEHTYGHEKIEYFSSGMEGMLIIIAALTIAWQAVHRLIHPEPLAQLGIGLAFSLTAAGLNAIVGYFLVRVGRRDRAIVLEADGRHLLTDVWTSVGVAVGLIVVLLTGYQPLDSLIALLVAAQILWTGGRIIQRSFQGLMDVALPPADLSALRQLLAEKLGPGMSYHALRSRAAGARRIVDFHLLVPGALSVLEAHAFADELEQAIENALPGSDVTIHIEPIEAEASWRDNRLASVEMPGGAAGAAGTAGAAGEATP
jgi:cation diffusion facilitator family transporter